MGESERPRKEEETTSEKPVVTAPRGSGSKLRKVAAGIAGVAIGLAIAEGAFYLRDDGAFPHLNVYQADEGLGLRLRPGATQRVKFGGAVAAHAEARGDEEDLRRGRRIAAGGRDSNGCARVSGRVEEVRARAHGHGTHAGAGRRRSGGNGGSWREGVGRDGSVESGEPRGVLASGPALDGEGTQGARGGHCGAAGSL